MAEAIASAFAHAGFTVTELLQGQITHTDLTWQTPPLVCTYTLKGIPLNEYLDYPIAINANTFGSAYLDTLHKLYYAAGEVVGGGGYRGFSTVLQRCLEGERLLRFAIPRGYPEELDPYAATVFALEAAHVLKTSYSRADLVSDDSNYYCQLGTQIIGVKDGRIADGGPWADLDVSGQVQGLLEEPRGIFRTDCEYSVIDKLRSILYENANKFKEYNGVDWALQACRILYNGATPKELINAIEGLPRKVFATKHRIKTLEECLAMMESWSITDRVKYAELLNRLVPAIMTIQVFQRSIYNPYMRIPTLMQPKVEKKIITKLKALIDKERTDLGE